MNKLPLLLLLALLLAACAPVGAPSPTAFPPLASTPTNTSEPSTATPAPTQPPSDTAPAFTDCTLLPALPSCGGARLPLAGLLAFHDKTGGRLVVADFDRGVAWQVPGPGLEQFSFSPSGKLFASLLLNGIAIAPALIYDSSSGKQIDQVKLQSPGVAWTPADQLASSPFRTVYSDAGDAAWIDTSTALAHVRFAADPSKDVTWPVAPGPSDQVFQAVSWVPGSSLLLFEGHYGGNSMWTDGGALSTLDVKTGALKDLGANMLLDFHFQWNPKQPGVLVFGQSGKSPVMGGQQLAVLDVLSGKLANPISDPNVVVSAPAWLPDGTGIVFAASMPGAAPAADAPFALPAIYFINRDGSGLKRLTQTGQNERDDIPQLLADGAHFLYFRTDTQAQTFSVRLGSLDGSLDAAVTGSLAAPQCAPACAWDTAAVYRP